MSSDVVQVEELENKSAAEADGYTVLAAHVAGAHGVTGNLRLKLIGANAEVAAESMRSSRVVKAAKENDAPTRLLTIASLRRLNSAKSGWTVHFKEITNRTEAETLIGYSLYIQEAQRAQLADGEYYVDQLLGLALVTDTGHALGTLTDVLNTPANDVYVADSGVLVPAVPDFILGIDLEQRRITVRDVPGLREGT